ncbi:MAG: LytR/AlgR family response regulator transcription factor [Flavobacteriaceae bacterium]
MAQETQNLPSILIVEDDMIIAADISTQLSKLGYDVMGINTKAEDALNTIAGNRPDLVLMDIVLSGKMNGIEAATHILEQYQIPVIFLTSNTDNATFQQALNARPFAFIAKPFQRSVVARTLQIALQRSAVEQDAQSDTSGSDGDHVAAMEDRLFLRHRGHMVKVELSEILFVEADRNYCKVVTADRSYLLSVPLRNLETQLPQEQFLRVHRSFVVNLNKVDAISEYYEYLVIGKRHVPISRRQKEGVVKRLKRI